MAGIIACIGSGNMGRALMKGAAARAGAKQIFFTDVDHNKALETAKALGAEVLDTNAEAARRSAYVFLAVKPQVMPAALEEIAPVLAARRGGPENSLESGAENNPERVPDGGVKALVSMAAGWSIGNIQSLLQRRGAAGIPVVRLMPNTPALISRGMIALSASPEVTAAALEELEGFLSAAGIVDRVAESCLDAVTGLSGSGPAFAYMFIEALADGGVKAGLPRDKALRYAAQTVLGAAAMVQETGRHPGELKDMVTSPAGTTIAGVAALERAGFRGAVMDAVEAAWRRAVELGPSA
ncbi:MAG: pyrroline-5-carboxylate reductase [Treponema sp.]|jgi:pyrroline-5-carboxylate reductase|nr:pyrroline-5-carboxylate reductase [Treponema sp.]